MANNSIYENMGLTDMSYLFDSDTTDGALQTDTIDPVQEVGKPDTTMVRIDSLSAFKNHPFHVDTTTEDFEQLVDSVRENGIIVPIFVRPTGEDEYEIIAGHCRVAAARECGLEEVPAVIRPLDDYEATLVMVHTNINGRGQISISEKAKAYRMCMDAEKHQGKKGTDTAARVGNGVDSKRQVYRFIRLSYLLDSFLELIDSSKVSISTGLEISYLDEISQQSLQEYIDIMGKIPSTEQAARLREMYEKNGESLTYEKILAELVEKPKVKSVTKVSFKTKELAGYFAEGTEPEEMTNVIIKLLTKYHDGAFDDMID